MAQGLALRQSFTLLFLATHSIAARLAPRQSFTLLFLATHSIAARLAPRQSVGLLLYSQQSCSSCAQTKRCFVNLGSGMKIAMFSLENGLISCHGTIKLRPA
ncbi:hypothetical protein NG55_14325 [Acinetobacter gyllenbergii]|nr:hypothetical protein NG55_14325 [Acinetobacter gyllenbergii]